MKPVEVVRHGDVISRVVEADGSIAMASPKHPVDGGGFADHKAALHLAAQINERRAAKACDEGGQDPFTELKTATVQLYTADFAKSEKPARKGKRRGKH